MKKRILVILCLLALCALVLSACVHNNGCDHKLSKVDANEATCTENGNVEYWHCSVCNKNFTDQTAETEITDVVIPAAHSFGDYSYDYDAKQYERFCSKCSHSESVPAGTSEYPLLARNETELAQTVGSAQENAVIKLANDIVVTSQNFSVVLRLPEGGTLDLGGYTVTVEKNPGGFVVEGTNVTLQNGKVNQSYYGGYSVCLGDEGDNNSVTVKNLVCKGGFNVYNCVVTVENCTIDNRICSDSQQYTYYALWADAHSTVIVESGVYYGGEIACVHSCAGEASNNPDEDGRGKIVINGGEFHGKIVATDLTVINGGEFDGEISVSAYTSNSVTYQGQLVVSKDYGKELNVVCGSSGCDLVTSEDENGNTVYKTAPKEQSAV